MGHREKGKSATIQHLLNTDIADSISALKFIPCSEGIEETLVLVSSWDGFARIYDIKINCLKYLSRPNAPILGCCPMSHNKFAYGGLDNKVVTVDVVKESEEICGLHNDAIRCVAFCKERNTFITGSWDTTVKLWNPSVPGECMTLKQPNQVFCLSVIDELLVVGTAGRTIAIWDLRSTYKPLHIRSTNVRRYQTRCIDISPDKTRYVIGTIDGVTSMECISKHTPEVNLAFKSHVEMENGIENSHPINAIKFHPHTSLFASGGSDGKLKIWDFETKKMVTVYSTYPTAVAAMDLSASGDTMAVGCSYMHDRDIAPDPIPQNQIFIRKSKAQGTSAALSPLNGSG